MTIKLIFILVLIFGNAELQWETSFTKAQAKAKEQNKLILMRFTGSDWCANCIRLDTTLIETEEFITFAKDKFVLIYLDFPSKEENKLSPKLTAQNQVLLKKYNPGGGFPAMVVLKFDGKLIGQLNVRPNNAEGYIKLLSELIE